MGSLSLLLQWSSGHEKIAFTFHVFQRSEQRRPQIRFFHSLLWVILGKGGGQVSDTAANSTPRYGRPGTPEPWGEGSPQMLHWHFDSCSISFIKLGPFPVFFPKRSYPISSVCTAHNDIRGSEGSRDNSVFLFLCHTLHVMKWLHVNRERFSFLDFKLLLKRWDQWSDVYKLVWELELKIKFWRCNSGWALPLRGRAFTAGRPLGNSTPLCPKMPGISIF